MRWLPSLANLNTCFRKAAAPNNGAAAFFFSTHYSVLHHVSPFFGDENFAGYRPARRAERKDPCRRPIQLYPKPKGMGSFHHPE